MTGIDKPFDGSKHKDGYVKVCATWAQTMWGLEMSQEPVTKFEGLDKPTEMFDNCGAYDVNNDSATIRKGSTFPAW